MKSIRLSEIQRLRLALEGETARADAAEKALADLEWHDDMTTVPKEMFIWARPKGEGRWGLGLAYHTVSGGWADAYGDPHAHDATRWARLPRAPK